MSGSVARRVAFHAFSHAGKLLLGRFGLVAGLPFGGGQAMDHLARRGLVQRRAGVDDPVRKAIPAEPGQPHQFDVLRIMPVAQVPDETTECRRRHGIGQRVERIGPSIW